MSCRGLLLPWAIAGCTFEPPPVDRPEGPPPVPAPVIESMAMSEAHVGDLLTFSGDRFIAEEWGQVEIGFRGTFTHDGGAEETTATLLAEESGEGWVEARLGPFTVPFIPRGNVTGVFRGAAFAVNRAFDGRWEEQDESTWPAVELTVLPSIVVQKFEPKLQRIEIGPPDAIAGTPYQLVIEAVGFSLASIEYELGEGVLIDGRDGDVVIHDALGATDTLGDRELFSFAPVPTGSQEFVAPIVIRASSQSGETYSLELNAVVH
jgi:hypothetical protein